MKVAFSFTIEASPSEQKTKVRNIKTIQIADEKVVYGFPASMQNVNLHPELANNPTVKE